MHERPQSHLDSSAKRIHDSCGEVIDRACIEQVIRRSLRFRAVARAARFRGVSDLGCAFSLVIKIIEETVL